MLETRMISKNIYVGRTEFVADEDSFIFLRNENTLPAGHFIRYL